MATIVADHVSQWTPASIDGEERELRVGTWPNIERIPFSWNASLSKWVSAPIKDLVKGNDLNWLDVAEAGGAAATNWAYYGYPDFSALPQANYTLRPVRRVAEMYAAGVHLQDSASARCQIVSGAGVMEISPVLYPFDDNDPVVFVNDVAAQHYKPSPTGIGRGNTLSHTGTVIQKQFMPWQDVSLLQINSDGTTSSTPVTPTKNFLFAWPYARNTTDGTGRSAGYTYHMRWVS